MTCPSLLASCFFLLFSFYHFDRISLFRPGWPQTCNPLVSLVLRLQVFTTMHTWLFFFPSETDCRYVVQGSASRVTVFTGTHHYHQLGNLFCLFFFSLIDFFFKLDLRKKPSPCNQRVPFLALFSEKRERNFRIYPGYRVNA